jgi:hypothetical protein
VLSGVSSAVRFPKGCYVSRVLSGFSRAFRFLKCCQVSKLGFFVISARVCCHRRVCWSFLKGHLVCSRTWNILPTLRWSWVHEQVLEQVTVPKDGKQPALIEYLIAAGFSTTRIVVHDVSVIEHGSGDTEVDWVRNNVEEKNWFWL